MGISSPIEPFSIHDHTIELEKNSVQLWWTVNDEEHEILFELHVKTTGWIALGISPGREKSNRLIHVKHSTQLEV